MEHRATDEKFSGGLQSRSDVGVVGIIDCDPRFASMLGGLADATAAEEADRVLQTLAEDCVELQDVHAAVVTLNDNGGLRTAASSRGAAQTARALDANRDSPALLAYRMREPVTVNRLEDARPYWPEFANAVLEQGYRSTRAVPMSASHDCIGALNLFSHEPDQADEVTWLAQTLAEVVTSGVVQRRRLDEALTTSRQLQHALDSRVVIEQAKGILAERMHMTPSECFESMRRFSRDHNLRLREVATAVVNHELPDDQVIPFALQ